MRSKILALAIAAAMFALLNPRFLPAQPPIEAEPDKAQLTEAQRRVTIRAIDPQGISGSLVLAGQAVPAVAVSTFFDLAHGTKARTVVLQIGDDAIDPAELQRLHDGWEKSEAAAIVWFAIRGRDDANRGEVVAALQQSTGVWMAAKDSRKLREIIGGSAVEEELRKLPDRKGVVGGSAAAAATMSAVCFTGAESDTTDAGLGLLPAAIILAASLQHDGATRLADALPRHPGHVGYEIQGNAALVVSGRRIRAEGEGAITVHVPAGGGRPALEQVLDGRQRQADLTTLRKLAIERLGPAFPPAQPDPPCLKNGTLMIIGGGGIPDGLLKRFVEAAGGENARIVVFPTAMPDPLPEKSGIADAFRREGAKHVTVLPGRRLAEVESDAFLAELREATGIWFGGGRQWRFADAYLDTKAHALMHEVLCRGGVIAGSSAGASIQAEYLARANPLGNLDIMAEGYERGLGFLSGAAVDQHFTQRGRQKDMTQLVDTYPQLLGIGIDESTAIVVTGCVAEVVGKHVVCFYDRNKPVNEGESDHEIVQPGGRYDLKARKVLDPGTATEAKSSKS